MHGNAGKNADYFHRAVMVQRKGKAEKNVGWFNVVERNLILFSFYPTLSFIPEPFFFSGAAAAFRAARARRGQDATGSRFDQLGAVQENLHESP